jgi:hypothetical protein
MKINRKAVFILSQGVRPQVSVLRDSKIGVAVKWGDNGVDVKQSRGSDEITITIITMAHI